MRSLICFELKKIITRKSTWVSAVALYALLCVLMAANILQAVAYDNETGQRYSGLTAINYEKSIVKPHAGLLTPQLISEEITGYQQEAFATVSPQEVVDLSSAAAYDLMEELLPAAECARLQSPYYGYLLSPWAQNGSGAFQTAARMQLDGTDPSTFYEALQAKTLRQLDAGLDPSSAAPLTNAEYDFWKQKVEALPTPFEYGYAGGWQDLLNCLSFLVFGMLAICIGLTPVFCGEYAARTDAVLLATRYGRTRLIAAKVAASLLFATAYYLLYAATIAGIILACYGTDGAHLPIQVLASTSPYNITVSQAVWLGMGVSYVMTLGFTGLTLLLSSRLRSQVAVFAIDACLLLITGFVGTSAKGLLLKLFSLFPINGLSVGVLAKNFLSYSAGPLVLEPATAIALTWFVAAAASITAAALIFRRHQVA